MFEWIFRNSTIEAWIGSTPNDKRNLFRLLKKAKKYPADERNIFFLENPALLSFKRLQRAVKAQYSLQLANPLLLETIDCWNEFHGQLVSNVNDYPIGHGPIERLLQRHKTGELTFDVACSLAASPSVCWHLSLVYVTGLSRYNEKNALNGNWRDAVLQHQLLLTAVDAGHDDLSEDLSQIKAEAHIAWLDIVTRTLNTVPNETLYFDAIKRGQNALSEFDLDPETRAHLLHRLGVLNLDPFVANGSFRSNEDIETWLARGKQEFGFNASSKTYAFFSNPSPRMELATEFLTEAVSLRSGRPKARSLKALAEAQCAQVQLGDNTKIGKTIITIDLALEILDPALDFLEISSLERTRNSVAQSNQENKNEANTALYPSVPNKKEYDDVDEIINAMLAKDVPSFPNGVIQQNLVLELISRAREESRHDVESALRACKAAAIASANFNEEMRISTAAQIRTVLILMFDNSKITQNAHNLTEFLQRISDWKREENPKDEVVGAAILAAAFTSASQDNEDLSLEMVQYIENHLHDFWSDYSIILIDFLGAIYTGLGVNAFESDDFGKAAKNYLLAFSEFLNENLPDCAQNMIARVLALTLEGLSGDDVQKLAPWLVAVVLNADRLGSEAVQTAQLLVSNLFSSLHADGEADAHLMHLLLCLAKGLLFSEQVLMDLEKQSFDCEDNQGILKQIMALRQESNKQQSGIHEVMSEGLLCKYFTGDIPVSGSSADEQLRNLMHRFDKNLSDKMLRVMKMNAEAILSFDLMQEGLADTDVLINYYFGSGRSGKIALYCFVVASDYMCVVVNENLAEAGSVWVIPGLNDAKTDLAGYLLMGVRAHIQNDPQFTDFVAAESAAALNQLAKILFPPDLKKVLKELKSRGKNHLCFVPHRALHFCPIHLVPLEDARLVVDDWIVSYLPHTAILLQQPKEKPGRKLKAFGLSFSNPHEGLSPLPEAGREAQEIAKLFNTDPVLDSKVSKEALLDALTTSDMVHIASHGQHNVEAPAFQSIILNGGEELNAYELLDCDLRSLDLVTLSACETALGRIDYSDNLRGLPASLFIRGASTIIGTLWPIETKTAQKFFTCFYGQIAEGTDKLSAFHTAQKETRESHPEYRDWGAFYYSGSWKQG